MSKKHLHNQAAIPLAPAVFKVSLPYLLYLPIQMRCFVFFSADNIFERIFRVPLS